MQIWANNGVPVHADGVLDSTFLVCLLSVPQADHAEYVYVHAEGDGVHALVNTAAVAGVPEHPAGVFAVTVRV